MDTHTEQTPAPPPPVKTTSKPTFVQKDEFIYDQPEHVEADEYEQLED